MARVWWCKHSGVRLTGSFMWRWMLWFMCCMFRPVTLLSSGLSLCVFYSSHGHAHCNLRLTSPKYSSGSLYPCNTSSQNLGRISEHLVTFNDSPADLLALFYAWGNFKWRSIVLGNHIRNPRDCLSASSKRLLHQFYFPVPTFKYGWMLLMWIMLALKQRSSFHSWEIKTLCRSNSWSSAS